MIKKNDLVAIIGSISRGDKVIEALESLGGKNTFSLNGNEIQAVYYIKIPGIDNTIMKTYDPGNNLSSGVRIYSLEAFLKEEKEDGVIINKKEEKMEENVDKAFAPDLKGQDYSGRRYGYKIPSGYEFDKIDRGEIILKPKGPFIPKTFEECCEVLKIKPSDLFREHHENVPLGYVSKMDNLYKLIICKNAYDKLFKKDIDSDSEVIGSITLPINSELTLTFPNSWIVDEFYRNFKDIIEKLKNL
jgi:hypothetical protein